MHLNQFERRAEGKGVVVGKRILYGTTEIKEMGLSEYSWLVKTWGLKVILQMRKGVNIEALKAAWTLGKKQILSPVAQTTKNLLAMQETWVRLVHGWRRSPGEGNGYPLQYSCLENPMDRGAWQATVHGVAKTQIRLSNWAQILIRDMSWGKWRKRNEMGKTGGGARFPKGSSYD